MYADVVVTTSGKGVADLECPGIYIFDQRFPKSSLDSLRPFHNVDLFENIFEPFFENADLVGEYVLLLDCEEEVELFSPRGVTTALQLRRREDIETLTLHDRPRIFELMNVNGEPKCTFKLID